jgi:hypothetical protein
MRMPRITWREFEAVLVSFSLGRAAAIGSGGTVIDDAPLSFHNIRGRTLPLGTMRQIVKARAIPETEWLK